MGLPEPASHDTVMRWDSSHSRRKSAAESDHDSCWQPRAAEVGGGGEAGRIQLHHDGDRAACQENIAITDEGRNTDPLIAHEQSMIAVGQRVCCAANLHEWSSLLSE
jgi:hypothetical protein